MSVGHGGNNSKHTGVEKLFILEYLEAKFQDAIEDLYDNGNTKPTDPATKGSDVEVRVYDPYNSSHDFFIMITPNHEHGSFSDTFKYYEEIHKRYRTLPDSTLFISDFKDPWGKFLKSIENPQTPKTPEQLYDEMKVKCFGVGYPNLSASSSETTLYFTAEQVAKFYGVEKLPSSLRISKKHRGRPDKAPKK